MMNEQAILDLINLAKEIRDEEYEGATTIFTRISATIEAAEQALKDIKLNHDITIKAITDTLAGSGISDEARRALQMSIYADDQVAMSSVGSLLDAPL